eukprot:135886-Prorocentrum_minimum.AAC.1
MQEEIFRVQKSAEDLMSAVHDATVVLERDQTRFKKLGIPFTLEDVKGTRVSSLRLAEVSPGGVN